MSAHQTVVCGTNGAYGQSLCLSPYLPGLRHLNDSQRRVEWLVPRPCEVKARGLLRNQDKPELYSKFQASLGYRPEISKSFSTLI